MLSAFFHWLNVNGQAVQGLALIATLALLVWQSRQLGRQVELSNIANSSTHFKDLNAFMLQNPESAKLAGESYSDLFAALLIGTIETRYLLRKARLISRSPWKGDIQTMKDVYSLPFVVTAWNRLRPEYDPRFVRFIDREVLPYATKRTTHLSDESHPVATESPPGN